MSTQSDTPPPALVGDDPRRSSLLEAAFGVFARYGFRKTSMDEVARAAQISRQGLYLHFANKEDLFRATVVFMVENSLASALKGLRSTERIEDSLLAAYDAWVGRFVGRFGVDSIDLIEAAEGFICTLMAEKQRAFDEAVAVRLSEARLDTAYTEAGISTLQLAQSLSAAAKGLKHTCESREQFLQAFRTTVRIHCAPVSGCSWGKVMAKAGALMRKATCGSKPCRKK